MSETTAPSVNSWLEDELYHQYLYDRKTVDAGWKQVFENDRLPSNGTTITIEPVTVEQIVDEPREMRTWPLRRWLRWRWGKTIRPCRCAGPR